MNSQPSAAMENGLTAQLMNSVTPMPRQCSRTLPMAAKSTLTSMGMIISQIRAATGRLTCASSAAPIAWKTAGKPVAEGDARDDAERDPEGEVAFEDGHFLRSTGRCGTEGTGGNRQQERDRPADDQHGGRPEETGRHAAQPDRARRTAGCRSGARWRSPHSRSRHPRRPSPNRHRPGSGRSAARS